MRHLNVNAVCFCIALTFMAVFPRLAYAIETPVYLPHIEPIAKSKISVYFSQNNLKFEDYRFAQIDINGDNFPEFLAQKTSCADQKTFCDYMILAEDGKTVISLLSISAKNLAISDTKTNGIHDILAIQSKKNDYEYLRYVWSPADMTFLLAEPQIEGQ